MCACLLTRCVSATRVGIVRIQAESRLTQLAGSVLRNALKGDEISMMGLDVIWGEKESNCVWNSVAPSRKKRRAPPFRGAASAIFSKAPSVSAPSPSPAPSSSGEGADEGGPSPVAARAITVEAVKDAVTAAETVAVTATSAPTAVALASGTALDGTSSMDSGANSSESLSSSSNPVAKEAAAASQGQASFVLLVLEGSVTAVYGGDVIEGGEAGDSEGDVGVQGPTHERVLEPGTISSHAILRASEVVLCCASQLDARRLAAVTLLYLRGLSCVAQTLMLLLIPVPMRLYIIYVYAE